MSIFLSHEVVVFLLIEIILFALMSVAQANIVLILRAWNFEASTPLQYQLEKKNYLINTILYFTVAVKIILFLFFVQSIDSLSGIVPGAMCSAGVVGANGYGNLLLLLKLVLIFGFGLWLIINALDIKAVNFPFLRKKYWLFTVLFCVTLGEFFLEIAYFSHIPLNVPVFCCSVVFQAPKLPFGYTQPFLVTLFYLFFGMIVLFNLLKHTVASFICNAMFLFVAYYAITYFFGLYIYEMPNHQCPYCMLQKEYHYIGYVIWGTLFLGIFFGMMPFLMERLTHTVYHHFLKASIYLLSITVSICTFYVIRYYIGTGVFL